MKKRLGFLLAAMFWTGGSVAAQQHPLDPLTQTELKVMVDTLKADPRLPKESLYPTVVLKEPAKNLVKNWKKGNPVPREASVVVIDRKANKTFEAVVDVKGKKVLSWAHIPGVQPGVLVEEYETPREIVRKDPKVIAALKKRGIEDPENVQVDVWAAGILSKEERASGARLLRCLLYYRPAGHFNPYYRPIEGLIAVVDLSKDAVVRLEEDGDAPIIPASQLGELTEAAQPQLRTSTAGMKCSWPEGDGFTVNGHEVTWQNWKFRYAMNPREGLVLYDLRYVDQGRERPVLYRGSLSEMVVPYGDPDKNWSWRNAFDVGEYGVGRLANTLRPGAEVPTYSTMLDSVFADDFGKPYVQKNSVAIYEREHGILWKHLDFDTGHDETRRARWLYLTYVATVGNYDYALSWVLGQDGSITVDTQLTGIVLPKGVKETSYPGLSGEGVERYGRLVSPNVVAPNHQHFFNFRLDLDVDGVSNQLFEVNNKAAEMGPENPLGNGFYMELTQLKTEQESQRRMDQASARYWVVSNAEKTNTLGDPTSYMLVPGENSLPYLNPQAPVRKRASFLNSHLWGTKFEEGQLSGAGVYPNQSTEDTGLSAWSRDNASLDKNDLVLWYTLGVTHNPRPEEWPVMTSHHTGFKLLPNGFFSQSPALDVPSGLKTEN